MNTSFYIDIVCVTVADAQDDEGGNDDSGCYDGNDSSDDS